MKTRNLEEVRKEVGDLRDACGEPIDEKIKELVIGLRRWGIKTLMSCEGHMGHGCPYPWVDVSWDNLEDAARLLSVWWSGKEHRVPAADQPRWVMKPFAGMIRLFPEDKHSRDLEVLQEEAVAFGKFLQKIPDNRFVGRGLEEE